MPSQQSLDQQQYYGNPNNAFWYIISSLIGFSVDLTYEQRVAEIEASSIAVWDVLQECQRPGSLDASIVRSTEVSNDIEGFLRQHTSITLIAFNGGAAMTIFKRHCLPDLSKVQDLLQTPRLIQLPSTSPAYAAMKKQEKCHKWRDALVEFI